MFKKLERKSVFSVAVIMFALVFVSIKHVSGAGGGGGGGALFLKARLKRTPENTDTWACSLDVHITRVQRY